MRFLANLPATTPTRLMIGIVPALAILTGSAAGPDTLPGDVWITRLAQNVVPLELAGLLDVINTLGGTLGAILVTLAATVTLALLGRLNLAMLVLLTLPLRFVNSLLKVLLESPRPQDGIVRVAEQQDSFGFPSGHVMGATVLYGALLIAIPLVLKPGPLRNLAYGCAGAMILLMGLSRIYVGAHWPSDVAGGYLWGAIVLFGLVSAWRWGTAFMERRSADAKRPGDSQAEPIVSATAIAGD